MEGLRYDRIIPELNRMFPGFSAVYDLADLTEGLPGVHLGFFINFVADRWSNETLRTKLAAFVNTLSDSNEKLAKDIFYDFALDFQLHFREHGMNLDSFLILLNVKTKSDFQRALSFWDEANQGIRSYGRYHL